MIEIGEDDQKFMVPTWGPIFRRDIKSSGDSSEVTLLRPKLYLIPIPSASPYPPSGGGNLKRARVKATTFIATEGDGRG